MAAGAGSWPVRPRDGSAQTVGDMEEGQATNTMIRSAELDDENVPSWLGWSGPRLPQKGVDWPDWPVSTVYSEYCPGCMRVYGHY